MKAVLLAFVACMALCHVAIAFPAQSERSIKSDTEQKKQVSVAQKLLSSAVQPYAAFLFFRQGLTDEDMSPVTPRCQQDADCESGASFCSVSGECKPTLSIKSHCSRDQECSTGFCSKARLTGNRCLTKRLEGQACGASPTSACGEGLFCALGELRCRQQRGLHQACRSTNACAEGLACVNYHCQESHKPTKTTQEIAFQAMMKKRSFKHQPSGSWDQPHWFGKREGESDAQAEKRNFWPQPSGSWDQPHWFAKREGESDAQAEKRNFWPQPSGSWDQPHWFAKREGESDDQAEKRNFWPQPSGSWDHPHWLTVKREEASSGADNEKRNFWPQPSGSWDHPHWFARREEYGQPDSPVELRSLAEE